MHTKTHVAWLTIRLTAPNARRLSSTLASVVRRAHACGLKAATITHEAADVPAPRRQPREILLPDDVLGSVTIADDASKLREFVVQLGDLLGSDALVEIDGDAVAFERQPVGS